MEQIIGVDLGATNLRTALSDGNRILSFRSTPTERSKGAQGISNQIVQMIDELTREQPRPIEVKAIGIASIGPLDLATGTIVNTPNLPIKNIPITEPVYQAFGVPVFLVNDCNAAVLAEATYGDGFGKENVVYVTMSTGLGGGAIVDGHLLIGKDGNAAEVGHTTVDSQGTMQCSCGCRGHWEAYCSGENIPRYARHLISTLKPGEVSSSLLLANCEGDAAKLTAKRLFDAAEEGDRVSLDIVGEIGRLNAIGFANIVSILDPELVTIGGPVALNHPRLVLDPVISRIKQHTINRVPDIHVTKLGDNIVILGAIAYAISKTS